MTPLMFKTLLFLRTNRRFWNRALILKAIKTARTEKVMQRLAQEQKEDDMVEDDDE